MPLSQSAPPVNRLLSALPHKDRQRFVAGCEGVEVAFGQVLAEPGGPITHVYFPLSAQISLVTPIDDHPGLEVGLVGHEGMLGVSPTLGVDSWPLHAMVQGAGHCLRMESTRFGLELELSPALQGVLKRYLHVLMEQLARTAACTHYHLVEARLARWLLMTGDRAHSDSFHITHEFLAYMLGVRRVGVTKAAFSLQERHLIGYRRGDITIFDRGGLEAVSCHCYATDKATYARLMG